MVFTHSPYDLRVRTRALRSFPRPPPFPRAGSQGLLWTRTGSTISHVVGALRGERVGPRATKFLSNCHFATSHRVLCSNLLSIFAWLMRDPV